MFLGLQVQIARRLLDETSTAPNVLVPVWASFDSWEAMSAENLTALFGRLSDVPPFDEAMDIARSQFLSASFQYDLSDFCRQVRERVVEVGTDVGTDVQYLACFESDPHLKAHLYFIFDPTASLLRPFDVEKPIIGERDDMVVKVVVTKTKDSALLA